MSRLATALRRIRFVILRTAGSPPVAPHPALRRRSYLQLRSPRPAPARTSTVLTKRPHGRTHARESGYPGATDAAPEAPCSSQGQALGPRLRGGDEEEKIGVICLVRTTSSSLRLPWYSWWMCSQSAFCPCMPRLPDA